VSDDDDFPIHKMPDEVWEQEVDGFAHTVTINAMHFLEAGLCPDIRYDPAIAKVIAEEVFPEVSDMCRSLAHRLAERIDTLAELHMLEEGHHHE
jgi:hypothetical protein